MNPKKKKSLIIFVVIILSIYFSPLTWFKLNSEIKINTENSDNHGSNTNKITKGHHTGIFINPKEKKVIYPNGVTVTSSFILNFGLYLKINKEIDRKKVVNGITTVTHITANATIWGLGNTNAKKNSFNKALQKIINDN